MRPRRRAPPRAARGAVTSTSARVPGAKRKARPGASRMASTSARRAARPGVAGRRRSARAGRAAGGWPCRCSRRRWTAVPRARASSSVRRKLGSPGSVWGPPRPEGERGRGVGGGGAGGAGGPGREGLGRRGGGAGGGAGGGPVVGEGEGVARMSRAGLAAVGEGGEGLADEGVPALAGLGGLVGAGAADDEPGLRAGEGDVEEAAALLADQRAAGGFGLGEGPGGAVGGDLPDGLAGGFEAEDLRRVLGVAAGGGVGEDDDGGFEALGAVDGHDPDLVGGFLGAALHLDLGVVEPGDEAGEAGGLDGLVGEGLVDEGVDAVLGLGAEAGGELPAAVVADEDAGEELVRAEEVGLGEEVREEGARARASGGRCAARARASLRGGGRGRRARAR